MAALLAVIAQPFAHPLVAQTGTTPKPKIDPDRVGMTCAQILKMSSTEWTVYFNEKAKPDAADASASGSAIRASAVYGKCYAARTDALAATLVKSGKGPSKAVRADFTEFEAALKDFAAKALADSQPPADAQKKALASLYGEQFQYEFYEEYEPKSVRPADAKRAITGGEISAAPKNAATGSDAKLAPPKPAASTTSGAKQGPPAAPADTDEMTQAKNRFGELLGALPDDKLHELHAAFGEVVGLHELDNAMRLAVYRYAIFLLEPSSGETSYPPPF